MSAVRRSGGWELAFLFCLLLASCREAGTAPDAAALIEAERSFARASQSDGMKEAFLRFLAEDAIIFRPGPVNGRQWFAERPAPSGVLDWEPAVAELSRAGDLGYTLGPWQLRSTGDGDASVLHGHYMSVWKRGPTDDWKVVLDVGIAHERDRESPGEVAIAGGRRKPVSALDRGTDALLAADRAFSEHAGSTGIIAAYMGRSSEDVRLFRMHRLPIRGKEALRAALASGEEYRLFRPVAGTVAQSGDLGFTYGFSRSGRARDNQPGADEDCYVRVWRRSGNGGWEVAVDVQLPLG